MEFFTKQRCHHATTDLWLAHTWPGKNQPGFPRERAIGETELCSCPEFHVFWEEWHWRAGVFAAHCAPTELVPSRTLVAVSSGSILLLLVFFFIVQCFHSLHAI